MTDPRESAAVVREALVNYGTWRMQKPRREKALAALNVLLAEYEARDVCVRLYEETLRRIVDEGEFNPKDALIEAASVALAKEALVA